MGAGIYAGDSQWHPDMAAAPVRHVKLAMYLDPLTAATGALRLVPGSHLQGYEGNQDTLALWGIAPHDVPCYCPDSTPGDVVVFDLRTLHNAIGGGRRRRMNASEEFLEKRTTLMALIMNLVAEGLELDRALF